MRDRWATIIRCAEQRAAALHSAAASSTASASAARREVSLHFGFSIFLAIDGRRATHQ